jgi:hypothetical protein
VTGVPQKNRVSIEPTRFMTAGTFASTAAWSRPSPSRLPSFSSWSYVPGRPRISIARRPAAIASGLPLSVPA